MICKACAQGADLLQKDCSPARVELARELHHSICEGCDCQHRVDLQVGGRSIRK